MVYNDPGGPRDRGAHLDKPFAEDNTGFIGSGTQLTTGEALHHAQVIPSVLSWPDKKGAIDCYARNARIGHQGAAESGIAICPLEGFLKMAVNLQAAAKRHIEEFPADGWTEAECDQASYTSYKAVDVQGVEVVLSTSYLFTKSRISYFVRVDYEGDGTYVARIEHYLKVVNSGNGSVLRLAIADLFRAEVIEGYSGPYLQVRRPLSQVSYRNYPMTVAHISHKVVKCDATNANEEYRQNLWRFTAYSNTYVKRDASLA